MNVNFGLFPPLAERTHKKERKPAMSKRALEDLGNWLNTGID
jgi:methylenetetrahydrofolate--tRNA-(uracil-5-)-methyltransferase